MPRLLHLLSCSSADASTCTSPRSSIPKVSGSNVCIRILSLDTEDREGLVGTHADVSHCLHGQHGIKVVLIGHDNHVRLIGVRCDR